VTYTLHQKQLGDQIKKNEMGGVCGTHGGGERRIQSFVKGKLIKLRQNGDNWRNRLRVLMNHPNSFNAENCLVS